MFIHAVLMRAKIQKWGNSLGLRIPKALAEELSVTEGSAVELSVKDGRLVAAPERRKRYTLAELLAGVTPENRHPETDFGPPRGKEIW